MKHCDKIWSSRCLIEFNRWYLNSENGWYHFLLLNKSGTMYWKCLPFLSARKNQMSWSCFWRFMDYQNIPAGCVCLYTFMGVHGISERIGWLCQWMFANYQIISVGCVCVPVKIHGLPENKNNALYCMYNIAFYNPVFILGRTLQVSLVCQQTCDQTTCITPQKTAVCMITAVKESRNRPGVAQRVPGGLGSQIFKTFGTWRRWGCQPHAPAAFTPRNVPGTHFH